MSKLTFKCAAIPENIPLIDSLIEINIKSMHFFGYKKVCFAIHELVINSIEAMNKSNQYDKQITLTLVCNKKHVFFSINDFGGGLPLNFLNNIHLNPLENMGLNESGRGLALVNIFAGKLKYKEEKNGSFTYKIVVYMDKKLRK
jgi:anti-sigma regulatory factor (Ser/Thr protein kinase)